MNTREAIINNSYRLSPNQKHVWLQQHESGEGAPFRVQSAISIVGELDLKRLRRALRSVVVRHEILRTAFQIPAGMTIPVQTVCGAADPLLDEHDFESLDRAAQNDAVECIFQELLRHPLDLESGQVLHASLIRLSKVDHVLILSLPVLCADVQSLVNLQNELADLYRFDIDKMGEPDEPFQYADFAEWTNELFTGDVIHAGQDYWRNQEFNADAALYCEAKNPANADLNARVSRSKVKPDLAARMKVLCKEHGSSTSTLMLTCWRILLHRLSGQSDLTIGLYCDGRKFEEMGPALGLFDRYVPLSVKIKGDTRFVELSETMAKTTAVAEGWQEFFDWRYVESAAGDEPSLRFGFDFHKLPSESRAGILVLKSTRQYSCSDRFKLKLTCVETDESLSTELYFDPSLYENRYIESIVESFHQLLESAISEPQAEIGSLDILTASGLRRLLEDFNQTGFNYRHDVRAHQLFEEIAVTTPEKVAVVFDNREISYGELNARADELAGRLRGLGVGPEILCAVCVERSVEMVVGMLAVLKAGGCYVPLDPNYPQDRIAYILADAQPKLLLTDEQVLPKLPKNDAHVVLFNADIFSDADPITPSSEAASPEDLAYVIYTSGSTGKPKGVMITHGNLGHYVQSLPASLSLKESDRYLHTASISFSSSVRQLMMPLAIGATVVIAGSEQVKDPVALLDLVWLQAVTVLDLVPSYWRNWIYALSNSPDKKKSTLVGSAVRLTLSASEPLSYDVPRALASKMNSTVEHINMLGQTETTGIISLFPIDPSAAKTGIVAVGRPIGNTQIYLLDSDLRPVVFGAPGEIYIGGPNIGLGYLNDPELTAEKFITNPFNSDDTHRLYKTGDLGRYDADGQIEFLGRNDSQVKIRGHRIEPGEIEAALRQQADVRDAVVVATDDAQDGQKLVAYVVPKAANAPQIEGQERYRLPNNMSIVQQNRHETDFFYQQIFIDQTNFKHGIELRDGDVVVDVGANIGFFTMFVQQVWKDIKVYAFEPIPAIFKTLSTNVSLYGRDTELFQCGLAEEARDVVFTYYPNSSTQSGRYGDEQEERAVLRSIIGNQQSGDGDGLSEEYFDRLVEERVHGEKITCSLKTLSGVIRENKIEQIDLLKIDAEKSEFDVLRGIAKADWAKIRQLVIEAHDIDGQLKQLINLLEENGFVVIAEEDSYIQGSGLYNVYARRMADEATSEMPVKSGAPYPIPVVTGEVLSGARLREVLKETLPDYMIPSNFIILESLPMTPNGKVDRQALPGMDASRSAKENEIVEPVDELELRLVKMWERLLGVNPVGIRDNFFDLGGHSLLAVRLFSQIEKIFGKNLPLATLFESPTIEQLAVILRQTGWQPTWSSLVTIQPAGTKLPFFCIHALGGNVLEYQALASYLGAEQPFYGLQSLGLDGDQTPHVTIEEMAAHYISEIRTVQPEGPYMIGGRSLGGTVAFEMACQLRAENQEVSLLALLDTDPMGYHKLLADSDKRFSKVGHFFKRVKGHLVNLQQLSLRQRADYFRGKFRYVPGKIKNKLWKIAYKFFESTNLRLPKILQSVEEFNFMAVMNFGPKIYPGRVKLFWANEDLRGTYDVEAGWKFLATGGVDIINIPGNHLDIVKDPYVQVLAGKLKICIDEAQTTENTDRVSPVASPAGSSADVEQWINHVSVASY